MINAYNSNANYGNVPTKLIETDKEFWIRIATFKACGLENDCNVNNFDIPFVAYAASGHHMYFVHMLMLMNAKLKVATIPILIIVQEF